MRVYNKLVRDKIPSLISNNGEKAFIKILNDDEYKSELLKKLLEECNEVLAAKDEEKILELADMLEVMRTMAVLYGYSVAEVINVAEKKKEERGGFMEKIFLEYVDKKDIWLNEVFVLEYRLFHQGMVYIVLDLIDKKRHLFYN